MPQISEIIKEICQEFTDISYALDERRIRLWCAARARAYNRQYGRGGVTVVHKATGVSRPRIYEGLKELERVQKLPKTRVRRPGGGRKKTIEKYPGILEALERVVEPFTRGDPASPLRWTNKSTPRLQRTLVSQGYQVSQPQVGKLLTKLGYCLQAPRKTEEGGTHPDRDAQFDYIQDKIQAFQRQGWPVISVDTKKKENVGNYANNGREYHKKGQTVLLNFFVIYQHTSLKA